MFTVSMDIFSHGLWAGIGAEIIKRKKKKPLSIRLAMFWGVFPDLFAFTIPFLLLFWSGTFGYKISPQVWEISHPLYNISHSLVTFAVVMAALYLATRRIHLEMFGWLLHILMDIPTHSYRFFPTPFLWPISGFKFNGFSWGHPWFIALDYLLLAVVFLIIKKSGRKPDSE